MKWNGRTPFRWPCYASAPIQKKNLVPVQPIWCLAHPLSYLVSSSATVQRLLTGHLQSYTKTPRALSTNPTFRLTYNTKDPTAYTHVLNRYDFVKPPIHPAYSGSLRVISRHEKYFVIDRIGCTDIVCMYGSKQYFVILTMTADPSTRLPISILDHARCFENGDQNSTHAHTLDTRPNKCGRCSGKKAL